MSKQCIKRSIDELNTHAINLKAVAMLCGSGRDRGTVAGTGGRGCCTGWTGPPSSQLRQVNQLGISTHVVYSSNSNSGRVSFKCHKVCEATAT